jgi:cob(I)alamin adenosyltransferase|tara:strand:- start:1820 stop:2191 length:372 start_codon:yes stop_codon:yes gene_type:complete
MIDPATLAKELDAQKARVDNLLAEMNDNTTTIITAINNQRDRIQRLEASVGLAETFIVAVMQGAAGAIDVSRIIRDAEATLAKVRETAQEAPQSAEEDVSGTGGPDTATDASTDSKSGRRFDA